METSWNRRQGKDGGTAWLSDLTAVEPYLTSEDLAAYLRLNVKTVYRLTKAGKIPAVRVGQRWRFRKSQIDAWLQSHNTQE